MREVTELKISAESFSDNRPIIYTLLSNHQKMSLYDRPAKSILHPTDFSSTSESAFAHALAIAVNNQAELTIMHVITDSEEDVPWHDYPAVRQTLEKWGHLEKDSSRREVAEKLGIKVKKTVGYGNVVNSVIGYTERHEFDLIVMATNENGDHPFWIKHHVATPVSQETKLPTLFVPNEVSGCVSIEDGTTSLKQVLIPVDNKPNAQPVLERIVWAKDKIGGEKANVTLLHIGDPQKFPMITLPDLEGFSWKRVCRQGEPAVEILKMAEEVSADLIAMVTEGKHGFWDALRGSTVQRVLKRAPCLVFTIPSDS